LSTIGGHFKGVHRLGASPKMASNTTHNLPQPHQPITHQIDHLVVEPILLSLKMIQKFHPYSIIPVAKLKTYSKKVRVKDKKKKGRHVALLALNGS
jgi:hypothetical protein